MNKQTFFEHIWTHISKRLPPSSEHGLVLTYNSANGYIACWPAKMAREYAEQAINGEVKQDEWSWDRKFTHWAMPYPPADGQTYEEWINKAKSKKQRS